MRQSGILASAGLLAVNEMTERLAEDHANAKLLANGLCALPGIEIDPVKVQTNIVIFDIAKTGIAPADFVASMKARGVLIKNVSGLHPLLAGCLRLTVGTPEENQAMLAALKESLQ